MAIRNWVTKKVSRMIQEAVEPVKADVKKDASNKIGLAANVLKLLVCLGIGFVMLKDDDGASDIQPRRMEPTHITINNYIREKEDNNQ